MKKLVVFGTGEDSHKTVKSIAKSKVEIICFADNNSEKWTGKFYGKPIINPKHVCDINFDYIIVATANFWKPIRKQILKYGLPEDKVLLPYGKVGSKEISIYKNIFNRYGMMSLYYHRRKRFETFNPSFLGMLTDHNYFSRKDLYVAIKNNSNYIYGKTMDFGCGTQPYKKLFKTSKYIGVEIDIPGECKEKGIIYYDGKHLPFKNETFDSMISSEVFEHVINIEEMIKELNRVLKPGAHVLITVPFVYPRHCWPNDYRRYTYEGIKKLLTSNGFEILKCESNAGYIECIAELINNYVFINIKNKIVKRILIAHFNIWGIILSKFLPKSDFIYLDNVIVGKKCLKHS